MGAADHHDAGRNPVIARVVSRKQLCQELLIEFSEGDQHGVRRRAAAGVPLDQVEAGSAEGPLEPLGPGGWVTGKQNPRCGGPDRCLLAHAQLRSK